MSEASGSGVRDAEGFVHPEIFYAYGFEGRSMLAVRAPEAMSEKAEALIGRKLQFEGKTHKIVGVRRQIRGSIARGEPVGLEIRLIDTSV